MAVQWKITDVFGTDEEHNEGVLFDSFDEAKEECDRLHTKYDLDTDDGFGNELPFYRPFAVSVGGNNGQRTPF